MSRGKKLTPEEEEQMKALVEKMARMMPWVAIGMFLIAFLAIFAQAVWLK